MILLAFSPLYAIVFAANLVPAGQVWRWIANALLLATNLALVAVGALVLLSALFVPIASLDPALADLNLTPAALLILLTGIVGTLPLVPGLFERLVQTLRLQMDPANTLHRTALVFAIWLVGLTLMQFVLLMGQPVETLAAGGGLSLGAVWEQGIAFALFAILGVGLGLRRSGGEALARLGVTRPTLRHLGLALAAIVALTAWDWLLGLVWQTLAPGSYNRISEISGLLFSGLISPIGALSIGLAAGIGEELLFRGALQPRFGLAIATLLFTLGHVQYEFSPALLSVFVIGLVLGLVRQRANTTTAILIHAGYNTLNVLLSALAG